MKYSDVNIKRAPPCIEVFEKFTQQYDTWFIKNKWVYRSEIEAVRLCIPQDCFGLEVGVGTGRFAVPFNIELGLDPSKKMILVAKRRGIVVICGVGENLPFKEDAFDYVLNVTTLCFLEDPIKALEETKRVLKNSGVLIIGFVDKNSKLGKVYEAKKEKNKFYKPAKFYSVDDVKGLLTKLSFTDFSIYQTIFRPLDAITTTEPIKKGFGEGGFIVFKAKKK